MSGIEIAGLVLGAVPVMLEAIKGYRNTYDRIQEFKQATKQLQVLDAQFRVCRLNFLSECRLLLHLVLSDPQLSQEMITDEHHILWQDKTVEGQLSALLRDDLKACAVIVADTTATIKSFDRKLTKLQIPTNNSGGTLQRAKLSAAFILEKGRFERDIATLRKRNADLNLLRIHFTSMENPPSPSNPATSGAKIAIDNFGTIRLASSLLHDTLKMAWSCSDAAHLRHWVKLCVESPKPHNMSVKLDIAISSETATQKQGSTPIFWLYVQSESIQGHDKALGAQEAHFQSLVHNLQQSASTNPVCSPVKTLPSSVGANSINKVLPSTVDLCKVACVCSQLQFQSAAQSPHQREHCLGYLESMRNSRYTFFGPLVSTQSSSSRLASSSDDRITTLQDVIEQPQSSRLQLLHQYQLALQLARSVLQFHDTAWLPSIWKLGDLSIVGSDITDQSLNTLHLSTSFERATSAAAGGQALGGATNAAPSPATGPITPVDACCQRLSPAVYNESLFCLGIVLLEIAHCRTFEDMREGDPDEFYAAHRIVRGPPPLGPKYRKIVERCLRCDFGAGSEDLEDAELQRAVWSKVVYPLEALVRDIST